VAHKLIAYCFFFTIVDSSEEAVLYSRASSFCCYQLNQGPYVPYESASGVDVADRR